MNGRKSKMLRRAAVMMASQPDRLGWDGGGVAYPPKSFRRIYRRIKKSHDKDLIQVLAFIVAARKMADKAKQVQEAFSETRGSINDLQRVTKQIVKRYRRQQRAQRFKEMLRT